MAPKSFEIPDLRLENVLISCHLIFNPPLLNLLKKLKVEIKKIENEDDRMITFSERRSGIYKKASKLVTLTGA
ncbi:hypothetical protein WN944_024376 [Citrus x changshan-huyou]|uniref:MADS-box domain-containing protein n=1 Tax=Citrus x changshan-huyou TaxID=2935761 RepID=A0AAP0LMW8_9ROSI